MTTTPPTENVGTLQDHHADSPTPPHAAMIRQHTPYAPKCLPPFTLSEMKYVDRTPSNCVLVYIIPFGPGVPTKTIMEEILGEVAKVLPESFRSPLSVKFQVDRIDHVNEGQPHHRLRFHDPTLIDSFITCCDKLRLFLVVSESPAGLKFSVVPKHKLSDNGKALAFPLRFERDVNSAKRGQSKS